MKIALVHDWLVSMSGAERVLIELYHLFPAAPIYTLFADKKFTDQHFPNAKIITSWIQDIPGHKRWHRKALSPLMATAIESFDFSDFDVVISSSPFFSKGVVTRPHTRHICYCYSPTRQLWDRHADYENGGFMPALAKHVLRIWDRHAADRVDEFVAISDHVRQRIAKYYKRDARIIYPPVKQLLSNGKIDFSEYYLIVSRLYPHKNIDIAIEAFNKLGYTLLIIGGGPERNKLERLANKNIHFLGELGDEEIAAYYKYAKAFIMPQEEDFGLTPLEAMSYGIPVLALRRGGALETITEGVDGEFFDDPIPEALADGIRQLRERGEYNSETIRTSAAKFSVQRFRNDITELVNEITYRHN